MDTKLRGKVCIVTGASSGLGQTVAQMFASRGASVTLSGRDVDRLKSAVAKCITASSGHSDRFMYVSGDINDQKIREDIVAKTIEKFGRIDVVVANAGTGGSGGDLLTVTDKAFDEIMNTNLKSVFFFLQLAVPHLEKTKGSIVNVSSVLSSVPGPKAIPYCMAKAALDHMTRCLAVDLGPKGIRVNAVNPSMFPSRLSRLFAEQELSSLKKNAASEINKHPLLRSRLVTKEEVAESIYYLVSDASSFITGECLKIDGGRSFSGHL